MELFLSAVALGEFAEGFEDADHPVLRVARELHVLLPVDEPTALAYGRITRRLRERGELIGSNDLWIAATSLRHDLPLVTANVADFRRVPELELVGYRGGAWLREAADEKLLASETSVIRDVADLERFFEACDGRESKPEPDWLEHRKVIERSRTAGLDVT